MKATAIHSVVRNLKREVRKWRVPIVGLVAENTKDPYAVLISCLLSLRTKDQATAKATESLFQLAKTPKTMIRLEPNQIQEAIYPVGFYRTKALTILSVSHDLIARYGGLVPDELEELLSLKGVGRKTANLVVTLGFGKYGICVDTHVHRISNRLGYIKTKDPEASEMALRKKLPKQYWIIFNDLLVSFGQNLCKPVSPLCSLCAIRVHCDRVGVQRSR